MADQSEPAAERELSWWAPSQRGWWIAVLFMIGSTCFAVGSFPPTAAWLESAAGWVFFIGSIFFTTAAYLVYYEASNEGSGATERLIGFRARSIGWWAATVQLIGTLAFNRSTFNALRDLSARQEEALVWAPDAFGAIAFLVASVLALAEVCRRVWCWHPASLVWRIAVINLLGSIAFGLSAIGARILPSTGEVANATVANSFTFIGAVLFFLGALLLIPAGAEEPERTR